MNCRGFLARIKAFPAHPAHCLEPDQARYASCLDSSHLAHVRIVRRRGVRQHLSERQRTQHLIRNRQATVTQPVSSGRIFGRVSRYVHPPPETKWLSARAVLCPRKERRVTSSVTKLLTVLSPHGWCSTAGCVLKLQGNSFCSSVRCVLMFVLVAGQIRSTPTWCLSATALTSCHVDRSRTVLVLISHVQVEIEPAASCVHTGQPGTCWLNVVGIPS